MSYLIVLNSKTRKFGTKITLQLLHVKEHVFPIGYENKSHDMRLVRNPTIGNNFINVDHFRFT